MEGLEAQRRSLPGRDRGGAEPEPMSCDSQVRVFSATSAYLSFLIGQVSAKAADPAERRCGVGEKGGEREIDHKDLGHM